MKISKSLCSFCFACISILSTTLSAQSSETNYSQALGLSLKFYEAQRAIGPFPNVSWRKPASINDGSDVGIDLNGGWFDAGDYVKFNLPMSYSVGILNWGILSNIDGYTQANKLSYAKDQVKYALDYLLQTYQEGTNLNSPDDDKVYFQVADGNIDHNYWGAPENLNTVRKTFTCDKNGGCAAVSGSMVGALASGAILFKDDISYSTTLLSKAKNLYTFARTYQNDNDYPGAGQENFYPLYSNNKDQLAWGAIWLYKATKDTTYLNDAKSLMENEYPWGLSWDHLVSAVLLLLSEETKDNTYNNRVEVEIERWINEVPKTNAGLRVNSRWGSLRYSANMAYIALTYSDVVNDSTKKQRYITFAKSQIDYILGDNPNNFSYLVAYSDNFPQYVHHAAASGTTDINTPEVNKYIIEGALVGGPMSADDNDYYDVRAGEIGWVANEVTTDYNAAFTGALAKLNTLYPQAGTKTFPLTHLPSILFILQ